MAEFPKDKIAVVEKEIERLRKEIDDRIGSNHTLWRAGLAGLAAFIILKENLDVSRVILALPILCMAFAAHWLNQMLMLYRSGDSIAACEIKINHIARETLLYHETMLAMVRRSMLVERRVILYIAAALSAAIFWYSIHMAMPLYSGEKGLLLWRTGMALSVLVFVAAVVNFWRFLTFSWPSMSGVGMFGKSDGSS